MRIGITSAATISRSSTLTLTLALAVAQLGPAIAQDRPGDSEAARAIRSVLDKQEADWNRGDLDAFLEGYWRSPNVVFLSGGERAEGFDAMRDRYRKRYQAEGRAMGRLSFSEVAVQPLGAEAALVHGRWKLDLPDGKAPGGLYTLILRKFADGWKIVHDHTSAAESPAAPPAPGRPAPASATPGPTG